MDQTEHKFGLGSNIINLSNHKLTKSETSLLAKGLKFIPTPDQIKVDDLSGSVQNLSRRLKLTSFFYGDRQIPRRKVFKNKSTWTPPDKAINKNILEKLGEMEREVADLQVRKDNSNLKASELKALRNLRHNSSLVIKPADKGSATVIMNKEDYISEANRQLSDNRHYIKLDSPIYPQTSLKLEDILSKMHAKHEITKDEFEYLKPPSKPRERRFYLLPKIHKSVDKWTVPNKVPPGRPIVSDCESESYRVSEYIDSFLVKLATKHKSYVRDTSHFLELLRETKVPQHSLLVTLDVDSLYTNIDNEAGIEAVKQIFRDNPIPPTNRVRDMRPDESIIELLKLSLENNDFLFNNEWYLQISGTAMGKKFAPNYANIFMANWETTALNKCSKQPLLYLRYLDDIFIIWPHTETEFWDFFQILNTNTPSIKLKANIHKKQVDFLDVTIFKGNQFSQAGILDTKVYFKPTDTHELLHKSSFHPKHTFTGIIKSQIMRFHKICNNDQDFQSACNTLFKVLKQRHYSARYLRGVKSRTIAELNQKINTQGPLIGKIGPCGGRRCQTCKYIPSLTYIMNGTHRVRFSQNLDCNSENVIYLIQCSFCQNRYVGETGRSVRDRFNGHKRDKNHDISTNVTDHFLDFWGCDFDTKCQLIPLEQLPRSGCETTDKECRLDRENFWIKKTANISTMGS